MISIIIPVYNNTKKIMKCLDSINNSCFNHYEIIVVDDQSTDNKKIKDICFSRNAGYFLNSKKGPGSARNFGALKAAYGLLFFLDSDTEIFPDTLAKIIDLFNTNPELNFVNFPYHYLPINNGLTAKYKGLSQWNIFIKNTHIKEVQGGACVFKKDMFVKLGGWNDNIKSATVENEEFGERIFKFTGKSIPKAMNISIKHNFNNFYSCSANTLIRAREWYFYYKSGLLTLDKGTQPSKDMAIFNMCGLISIASLLIWAMSSHSLNSANSTVYFLISAFCFLAYLLYYKTFFKNALLIYGLRFMIFCVIFTNYISALAYAGAFAGLIKYCFDIANEL